MVHLVSAFHTGVCLWAEKLDYNNLTGFIYASNEIHAIMYIMICLIIIIGELYIGGVFPPPI